MCNVHAGDGLSSDDGLSVIRQGQLSVAVHIVL